MKENNDLERVFARMNIIPDEIIYYDGLDFVITPNLHFKASNFDPILIDIIRDYLLQDHSNLKLKRNNGPKIDSNTLFIKIVCDLIDMNYTTLNGQEVFLYLEHISKRNKYKHRIQTMLALRKTETLKMFNLT